MLNVAMVRWKRGEDSVRVGRGEQHLGFDSYITAVHHATGNNRDVVSLKQQTRSGISFWDDCHLDQRLFSIKVIYSSILSKKSVTRKIKRIPGL